MIALTLAAASLLALSLGVGLVRVFKGPTSEDRMMSVQLVSTTGIGIVLLIGPSQGMSSSIDLALIFALLGAISVAALAQRVARKGWHGD